MTSTQRIDFDLINAAARSELETLLRQWLPDGVMKGAEWVALNPTRNDRAAGSFSVDVSTGKWFDFATGDGGGDVVSLFAYLKGLAQVEAARTLAETYGYGEHKDLPREQKSQTQKDKRTITPIFPVPANAPALDHRKLGMRKPPSLTWPYRDAENRLLFYICRWDIEGASGERSKDIRPVSYCDVGDGKYGWKLRGMPAPRPLYRLPELVAAPDADVLITEGEKACDAAAVLFPELVTTTPAHGAMSPHQTDFSPLAGRSVIVAPDHDDAGRTFADTVASLAWHAGAASVQLMPPDRLGEWIWNGTSHCPRKDSIPPGWDLADALAEGWTANAIVSIAREVNLTTEVPKSAETRTDVRRESDKVAPGFRLSARGVEKRVDSGEWRWVCSHLEVCADTRNEGGDDWGRLLRLVDRDGREKEWAMPMSMLAGDGVAVRERLLALGLTTYSNKWERDALLEYITTARPAAKARCVNRVGWHGRAFVLPNETIASPAQPDAEHRERVVLQMRGAADHAAIEGGSFASWRTDIAERALGNSRLVFALSSAFAAPLLYLAGMEGGGFHFRGSSSTGKSTALVVAGSAWGGGGVRGYSRSWRTTDSGLEGVAALHSDMLLCLDDLGQVDAKDAGRAIYMLANGQGKARSTRRGQAVVPSEWRVLFLSSGELSLSDKIAEDGRYRRAAAGQEVRIVDVPADAGAGLGLFEDLHGEAAGDAFADALKEAAQTHFGHAGRAFVRRLIDRFDEATALTKELRREFIASICPPGADGQVHRAAARFALVAAGGELATRFELVPWPAGAAIAGAKRCFTDWLIHRGGGANAEEEIALSQVRAFIIAHGASRFEPMGEASESTHSGEQPEYRIANRVGFRRRARTGGFEYIVTSETWRNEVCKGLDPEMVAKILAGKGFLIRDKRRNQLKVRLPGFPNSIWCYVIAPEILGEAEEQGVVAAAGQ